MRQNKRSRDLEINSRSGGEIDRKTRVQREHIVCNKTLPDHIDQIIDFTGNLAPARTNR